MNPLGFPLLADENVHPDVVLFLRKQGHDIRSVAEEGLFGHSDLVILRMAHTDRRVVLTHDSDFGTLVITQDEPFTRIVYLCPGHMYPEFTIQTLRAVAAQFLDVHLPFIIVAEQRERTVQIRTRQL